MAVVSLCTIYEILIDNLRILPSNDFKHHGLSVCPARGHFAHLDTITGLELLNSVEIIKIYQTNGSLSWIYNLQIW